MLDNKDQKKSKYWSFLNASFSHEQCKLHLGHFLEFFWISTNSLYSVSIQV